MARTIINYLIVVSLSAAFLDIGLYLLNFESNFFGLFFIIIGLRGTIIALGSKT
jgi:hypothetical protein